MTKKFSFFLMGQKGFTILNEIISEFSPAVIDQVIAAKDINMEKDYFAEIKELCKQHEIPFFGRNQNFDIRTDVLFAVSWRWIINTDKKLIIIHDSLLPKYRGFAPLVNALINHEPEIGVSAIWAEKEYDTGDIIGQEKTAISYPIKISEAIEMITPLYYSLIKKIIKSILHSENLNIQKQQESMATYSLWRDEEDYRINWNESAAYIKRFIDALGSPYKGASTYINDSLVRILDAEVMADVTIENRTPGKVIFSQNGYPVVVCTGGLLQIKIAVDDVNRQSILPLKNFRVRFK